MKPFSIIEQRLQNENFFFFSKTHCDHVSPAALQNQLSLNYTGNYLMNYDLQSRPNCAHSYLFHPSQMCEFTLQFQSEPGKTRSGKKKKKLPYTGVRPRLHDFLSLNNDKIPHIELAHQYWYFLGNPNNRWTKIHARYVEYRLQAYLKNRGKRLFTTWLDHDNRNPASVEIQSVQHSTKKSQNWVFPQLRWRFLYSSKNHRHIEPSACSQTSCSQVKKNFRRCANASYKSSQTIHKKREGPSAID